MRIWSKSKHSVLMVCTANICRSPLAHGLLLHRLRQADMHKLVHVDSAGTHVSRARCRPDPRGQRVAQQHGFDISRQRARPLRMKDLECFDDILVMDGNNLQAIEHAFQGADLSRVKRILSFAGFQPVVDVPDPYYGNAEGFEMVYEILLPAVENYVNALPEVLFNVDDGT